MAELKTIDIPPEHWNSFKQKLIDEYGNTILINFISRKKLGCVFRRYTDFDSVYWEGYKIDFFDAKKRTFFLMKYSEFL